MQDSVLDYLEQLTLDELLVLDGACERLRSSQLSGADLPLESFLPSGTDNSRSSMLLELVRTEIEVRLSQGETPTAKEYLSRYPEFADRIPQILQEHLEDQSRLSSQSSLPADPEAFIGQRLGHYEILEIIGRGGMGLVLRARDTKLNRDVAIKLPSPQILGDCRTLENFVREAQIAAAVRHENIVTIHSVEEADGLPFLVMERIEGVSLENYVRTRESLSISEVISIGDQIASGLAAAHAGGLVHRDIKPSNILLETLRSRAAHANPSSSVSSWRIKLTDFGLAKFASEPIVDQRSLEYVTGTPQYMSPEQAAGQLTDARSDLFSLGGVLYFLCCGQPPFSGDSAQAILKQVRDCVPVQLRQRVPALPPSLVELIEQLMSRAPADRPTNAQAVCQVLHDLTASLPMTTLATDPMTRWWPNQLRLQLPLGLGLATVIVLTMIFLNSPSATRTVPKRDGSATTERPNQLQWSAPQRVEFVDGISDGSNPSLTGDGLRLFFISATREPGYLLEAIRTSIDQPFSIPTAVDLPPPVGAAVDATWSMGTPNISADGLTLLFYTGRPDGYGGSDLYESHRETLTSPWQPMENLGPGVNTHEMEYAPCLSRDGLTLYWFRTTDIDNADLWVASRQSRDEKFTDPRMLTELVNSSTNEQHSCLSSDGLQLIFDRGTPEPRLWIARRGSTSAAFETIDRFPLGPSWNDINAYAPTLALDNRLFMFTSNRVAGRQGFETGELWQSSSLP